MHSLPQRNRGHATAGFLAVLLLPEETRPKHQHLNSLAMCVGQDNFWSDE